jgi:hypothetical protein
MQELGQHEGPRFSKDKRLKSDYKHTICYKIIDYQSHITPSSGRYVTTLSNSQIKAAMSFIDDERPQATVEELFHRLVPTQGFPPISAVTLSKDLDGPIISVKDAAIHNQQRICNENKKVRADYGKRFSENSLHVFVFVDGFGFNLTM